MLSCIICVLLLRINGATSVYTLPALCQSPGHDRAFYTWHSDCRCRPERDDAANADLGGVAAGMCGEVLRGCPEQSPR